MQDDASEVAADPNTSNATRITHGLNAYAGLFPYVVSLRDQHNNHYCGGTLLSSYWVLSSALCNYKRHGEDVRIAVNSIDRRHGDLYQVNVIILHYAFSYAAKSNDIALLQSIDQMHNKVHFFNFRYATNFSDEIGTAIIMGWGTTVFGGPQSNNLKFAKVVTIKLKDCKARHKGVHIYDSTFCIVSYMAEGLCDGDFGGPVIANNELIGVASWSVLCGRGYADVVTRVSSYHSWIQNTMQQCFVHNMVKDPWP